MCKITDLGKQFFAANRHWLQLAGNWFVLAAFLGAVTFFLKPELIQTIAATFRDRFGANPALNFSLAIQIFLQNLTASAFALFGGVLLGLGPVVIIGINGFILGFVVTSLLVSSGSLVLALALILGGILPHGIFELSAFLAAGSLGLRLGTEWLRHESSGNRWPIFKQNFKQAILLFPIIAGVLFFAALIEVFVSGRIVDKF